MRIRHLFIAFVLFAATACGGDEPVDPSPQVLTGVILGIDAEALGQVESFELKAGDAIYDIYVDSEVEYGFPLGHLHEHLQSSEPVKVRLEDRDGKLVATSIDDA